MFRLTQIVSAAFCMIALASLATASTLEEVRKRGHLNCGVNLELPGFATESRNEEWTGLDVETCRAVAAAVLGDAGKVTFIRLSPRERFTALRSGIVDVLIRNTTWTLVRDTAMELNFAGVNYYDGQGFMVRKEFGLESATELDGAAICVAVGTTTELNLSDFFRAAEAEYRAVRFEEVSEAAAAYDQGQCDALTSDHSTLAAFRVTLNNPNQHEILPDVISKEPLGPVVRHGDDQWFDIVKWTMFALLQAEESGVKSHNVERMKESRNPVIRRLLGIDGEMGRNLGIDNSWAYEVIRQVGNYAEIYERNIGPDTPLQLPRGVNALWKDGGLHYPMPIR